MFAQREKSALFVIYRKFIKKENKNGIQQFYSVGMGGNDQQRA